MSAIIVGNEFTIIIVISNIGVIVRIKCSATQPSSTQNSFESSSKFFIKNWINNGIECRVGVAEPWEDFKCRIANASFTKCCYNIDTKEWHPAN